jgi:hypothetical protein
VLLGRYQEAWRSYPPFSEAEEEEEADSYYRGIIDSARFERLRGEYVADLDAGWALQVCRNELGADHPLTLRATCDAHVIMRLIDPHHCLRPGHHP